MQENMPKNMQKMQNNMQSMMMSFQENITYLSRNMQNML